MVKSHMVMEDDLTLGGGYTMQCKDDVLQKCALETYIILTDATPINLTKVYIICNTGCAATVH